MIHSRYKKSKPMRCNSPVHDADAAVELAADAVVLHHFVHPVQSLLGQLVLGAQQLQHLQLELAAHSNEFCQCNNVDTTVSALLQSTLSVMAYSKGQVIPSRSWAIVRVAMTIDKCPPPHVLDLLDATTQWVVLK